MLPKSTLALCSIHIAQNVTKNYTGQAASMFMECVKPFTLEKHKRKLNLFKAEYPDAHDYVMGKNPKRWARAYFKDLRTFGLIANNLAEQLNRLQKDSAGRSGS
jgi:hypothetical protein